MNQSRQTVQSVERTMKLLECFTMKKPELSLGELSKLTELPKSTVSRLTSTLIGMGYVKQDPKTLKYSLGFKLFYLGSVAMSNTTLRGVAVPHMQNLSNETRETITLNIVEEDQKVCIDMVESTEEIRNIARVGERNSLLLGVSGKVLLAYLDPIEQERIITKYIPEQNDANQEKEQIISKIKKIRELGYHLASEERIKGSFAISAPIFDYTQKLAGGITIAGPIHRISEDRAPYLIDQLLSTSERISEELGYIKSTHE